LKADQIIDQYFVGGFQGHRPGKIFPLGNGCPLQAFAEPVGLQQGDNQSASDDEHRNRQEQFASQMMKFHKALDLKIACLLHGDN
jgi:hypothetical protein